ncbi:hypothetical protein VTN77DRAFT_7208 [Rasamsonia byssochlamydoides]|uniref:uncharacterized protein n=1 Tax=Rasamsonia byssochlamydoides TaxID=89139 RepID=UPI003743E2FE
MPTIPPRDAYTKTSSRVSARLPAKTPAVLRANPRLSTSTDKPVRKAQPTQTTNHPAQGVPPSGRRHGPSALSKPAPRHGDTDKRLDEPGRTEKPLPASDGRCRQAAINGARTKPTDRNCTSATTKYTEYAHGDSKRDRRIVLDKDTLRRINQAGNLRVVSRADLLERFLRTLEEQAQLAANAQEHLIVLVFGHGDPDTYGVSIGGWLVQPDVVKNSGRPLLNTTEVAAAGPEQETRSWPVSRSTGRASGSTIATAILQSIIAIEESDMEAQEIREHPTYIQLALSIFKTLKKIDRFGEEQMIHFSAQDDSWETHYQQRVGLPLTSFKERRESLRPIASSDYQSPGITARNPEGTLRKVGTRRKRRQLKFLAKEYLTSYPGLDELAPNLALHQELRALLGGTENFNAEQLERLYNCVSYRLSALHEADEVRQHVGLQFAGIFDYRVEDWRPTQCQRELQSRVLHLLRTQRVLDKPLPGSGWSYPKPWHYLAIALVRPPTNLSRQDSIPAATTCTGIACRHTSGLACQAKGNDETS